MNKNEIWFFANCVEILQISSVSQSVIDDDLLINGVIGADGAMPCSFRIYGAKNSLRSFAAKASRAEDNTDLLVNEFFNEYLKDF